MKSRLCLSSLAKLIVFLKTLILISWCFCIEIWVDISKFIRHCLRTHPSLHHQQSFASLSTKPPTSFTLIIHIHWRSWIESNPWIYFQILDASPIFASPNPFKVFTHSILTTKFLNDLILESLQEPKSQRKPKPYLKT